MSITVHKHGAVGEILFSNPPHNYVSVTALIELADAVAQLDADPFIRASVLRTEGKIFCAGADLAGDRAMGHAGGHDDDPMLEFYRQAVRLYRRKKPIIAAVQGAAIGAGLGLAIMADFRVAAFEARFSANFARLGFHPGFGISVALPRLIGLQNASWMCLSSQRLKPEVALRTGLVDRLVTLDRLVEEAFEMAEAIAENAPLALLSVRKTLVGDLGDAVERQLAHEYGEQVRLKATADYAEGVASVFERRSAHFKGH